MNFYVLVNSFFYFLIWNALFIPNTDNYTLVICMSFLLLSPAPIVREFSQSTKDDRWLYRGFKGHPYDRALIIVAVATGLLGGAGAWGMELIKDNDLFTAAALIGSTILNAILVAVIQFVLFVKLKRSEGKK